MNVLLIILIAVFVLVFVQLVRNAIESYQEYLCGQKRPWPITKGPQLYVADPYYGSKLAPNVSVFIQRRVTKEHVFTNNLGFRTENKDLQQQVPVDIAFIGCSWVMGDGVEYEATFVSKVSKALNVNVANLGVGGYSITQAVRRLEKNIDFLRPRIILYCFLSLHINRAFKTNAHAGIIRRPVYVYYKNKKKIQMLEVGFNLSKKYIEKLSYYKMYPSTLHDYSFKDIYVFTIKQIMELVVMIRNGSIRNIILRKLGLKRWSYADGSLEENRKTVIYNAVKKLQILSREYGCMVMIHSLFYYNRMDVNNKQSVVDNCEGNSAKDSELFREAIKTEGSRNIIYLSSDLEKELYDNWLMKNGFKYGHYNEAIHLPDNNHPNKVGHSIIAESIVKQIKKYSVL